MPIKRKVSGIRGPIPSGYIVGRVDGGDGDAQLLNLEDLGGFGLITRGPGGGGPTPPATGGAGVVPLVTGSEPPVLVSDGAGNLIVVDFP